MSEETLEGAGENRGPENPMSETQLSAARSENGERANGAPAMGDVKPGMLGQALKLGLRDFVRKPMYGIGFGLFYVLGGWLMNWLTVASGQSYWLTFAAIGFPLLGPFAAVGLYEVSLRLERG